MKEEIQIKRDFAAAAPSKYMYFWLPFNDIPLTI
jgi:hypothetical protein